VLTPCRCPANHQPTQPACHRPWLLIISSICESPLIIWPSQTAALLEAANRAAPSGTRCTTPRQSRSGGRCAGSFSAAQWSSAPYSNLTCRLLSLMYKRLRHRAPLPAMFLVHPRAAAFAFHPVTVTFASSPTQHGRLRRRPLSHASAWGFLSHARAVLRLSCLPAALG
jgi:hypothetical protein